jgi:hypothetical protein
MKSKSNLNIGFFSHLTIKNPYNGSTLTQYLQKRMFDNQDLLIPTGYYEKYIPN